MSPAERVSLGISIAILLALIGLLTYQQLAGGVRPALIEAEPLLDQVRREGETYYLPIEVSNRGDLTAEEVLIEVSLDLGEGEPETSELTIMFLDGGATANATAIFRQDPRNGDLKVEVLNFLEP